MTFNKNDYDKRESKLLRSYTSTCYVENQEH